MDVDQVDRPVGLGPEHLEGGPAEEPEPPGVVGVIAAAGRAVEAVAVECGRMVDESKPVAVRLDIDERQVHRPGERLRIGNAERPSPGPRPPAPARTDSAA